MNRLCIPASILCMLLPVFGSVQAAAEPLPVHTLSLAQAQLAGSLRAWLAARDAAQRLEKAAALSQRAYELGETALAEVLLARRVAADAELAQLKLMEQSVLSRYRLLLDAHMLWPLDDDSALSVEGVRR